MDTNVLRERNCLRRDEYHAGQLAATQLIARGYRKLIYASPIFHDTVPHYSHVDRAKAVADAANAAGIELIERSMDFTSPVCEDVITPMANMLKPDVGIIAATDRTAMALLVQMSRLGLRPGPDVGLAACDRTEHTQRYWPGLSCVNVKRFGFGLDAADMMVQVLKSPQHVCDAKTVQWTWHDGDTAIDAHSR
jgi:DNA-binding LacI/PurR family transcriptional regulator